MNTVNKVMISGIIALSLSGMAYAAEIPAKPLQVAPGTAKLMTLQKPGYAKYKRCMKLKRARLGYSWHKALHRIKPLTPAQAKTVAEAAVILYGDSSMKVQQVTPVSSKQGHQNYQVLITNQQGKPMAKLMMNGSNGRLLKLNKQ